jgi:hypothetical protein
MRLRIWTKTGGLLLLLVGLLSASAGCTPGYKSRGTVKGQVTIGGKPLYAGTVTFTTADNRGGSATIDQSGNYVMGDAPVGDVKVTVTVPKVGGMVGMMGGKAGPPKSPAGEMKDPNNPGQSGTPQPAIDPKKIVPIPDKYASADTSGLTYKVEKGEQTFDIKLTP